MLNVCVFQSTAHVAQINILYSWISPLLLEVPHSFISQSVRCIAGMKLVFFINLCPACLCGVRGQKDLWACCLSRVMESSIMHPAGPHTLHLMDAAASREI